MTFATRLMLILTLTTALVSGLAAQETTATTTTTTTTAAAPAETTTAETTRDEAKSEERTEPVRETTTSYEIRHQFSSILNSNPHDLATVLVLDHGLLSNAEFLSGYPEVERFVNAHPEIRRNPRFYLGDFLHRRERGGLLEDSIEGLTIFAVFILIAFALAWLVRTLIEQKRWTRLSATQTEVHNKILDRFGTSAELLEYMKSAPGTKFLESAPIPLREERTPYNPSASRVLWSIQIGVVVAAGALGMLMVSMRFDKEAAQELFGLGMIAFSIGVGFVLSAFVSIFLSRRLGLWQPPDRIEESGHVR